MEVLLLWNSFLDSFTVKGVYVLLYMCMRAQVCVLIGELVERLMTGHYTVVSSASLLWVRSTAALAPRTPYHSIGPKRPPILPCLPVLDLCLQPSVDKFISLDSLALFFSHIHTQTACLAVTSQPSSELNSRPESL